MKKIILFALGIIQLWVFAQENQNKFVTVKGKEIISPEGKPLVLRGINLGFWLVPEGYIFKFDDANSWRLINQVFAELVGPDKARLFWEKYHQNYITKDDIKFIKSCGLNSIRVPFDFRLFTPEEFPDIWIDTGFKLLDNLVRWCNEENLYIILDMHCAPGGQTGDNIDNSWGYPWLFESEESQKRITEIWRRIADHNKNEKIIIGYDLMNEPIAHYFDAEKLNPKLEPLYKRITSAIREVDKNHLIFLGGAQWNTNFKAFGKPFDEKLVYNFHKYWCDTTQNEIQEYCDFRDKYNVPLWMSESGENKDEWIAGWRMMMDRNNISWCFWPYKKMDATSCLVQFDKPEFFDLIIKYANSPRNSFKDVRDLKPDVDKVRNALNKFLENCKFENCKLNKEYLKALGL